MQISDTCYYTHNDIHPSIYRPLDECGHLHLHLVKYFTRLLLPVSYCCQC